MQTLGDIDWSSWTPTMRGTLMFVLGDGQALLIRKKRGLGAGKINAPGGKIDPGETPLQAAVRETQEEVGVTPLHPEERGELSFQFVDGLRLHVRVFVARAWTGEPRESDEAIPIWTRLDALPYDEMWADDRVWVPELLAGRRFALRALFDDDAMLDHAIEVG
jgi:8-oxo-dGTP diphosphatase